LLGYIAFRLRLPVLNSLAWRVFFGRGSFPDLDGQLAREPIEQMG